MPKDNILPRKSRIQPPDGRPGGFNIYKPRMGQLAKPKHKVAPVTAGVSLANRFLRQITSLEGQTAAFVTLPRLFPKGYTRAALADVPKMRTMMQDAKKIVLDESFVTVVRDYAYRAHIRDIHALYAWGIPPLLPLWIEWEYDSEAIDSPLIGESNTGILIEQRDMMGMPNMLQGRLIYSVPDDGNACVMLPQSFLMKPGASLFSDDDLTAVAPALRTVFGRPKDKDTLRETLRKILLGEGDYDTGMVRGLAPLSDRVLPAMPHSGGRAITEVLGTLEIAPGGHASSAYRLGADQMSRALLMLRMVLPLVPVMLGMLSLAPTRHLVEKKPMIRSPERVNDWRWKHDHETVTLVRPITTAELVRHVASTPDPTRASPMLHDVMGFWRVYHGDPACDHVWHEEEADVGTATDLGRPHRTDRHRYRCTRCHGLRTWVHPHHRGSAERGVRSKDYIVTTDSKEA